MQVKQISRGKWQVDITDEDRKKIACVVNRLGSKAKLPTYGKWKNMSDEDIWEEIINQFCVMGSARLIEKLQDDTQRYAEFLDKLSIETLSKISMNRKQYIARQLQEYKATRFYNKNAERIDNCLENEETVRNGKLAFLEDLKKSEISNEDKIRDVLLEKLPFFKIKSISDLMITIGMARGFIAFDTRVIGLLNKHFGLNLKLEKIQSDEVLYKTIETSLRDICKEIGVDLSLLDRMLFNFNSEIDSIIGS